MLMVPRCRLERGWWIVEIITSVIIISAMCSTSRRRGEAERRVTDGARLGSLDLSRDLECRLL